MTGYEIRDALGRALPTPQLRTVGPCLTAVRRNF
jgi:hypothetical protein